jgi:isopentenyl diphosphate isomerase/L-lactate dehydrogenase-like FMN-dependent dehydrogenase
MSIETRKADHIRINLDEDVGFDRLTVGFEDYRFIHQALPELDLRLVDLTTRLFHKPLKAPVLISSMTGGTEQAQQINLNLAVAAQQYGVAMGLGSQRRASCGRRRRRRSRCATSHPIFYSLPTSVRCSSTMASMWSIATKRSR